MSNVPFDPYYKWLAIRPEEQPPNHYRLLGVGLFESDPDVISTAADQRMAHIRSFQNGPHAAVSQRVLNEIAAARLCLLNVEKRAKYDQSLQGATRTVSTSSSLKQAKSSSSALGTPAAEPSDLDLAAPSTTKTRKKNSGNLPRIAVIAGVCMVLLASIVALMSRGGNSSHATPPVATQGTVEPSAIVPKNEEPSQPVNLPERSVGEEPKPGVTDKKQAEPAPSEPAQLEPIPERGQTPRETVSYGEPSAPARSQSPSRDRLSAVKPAQAAKPVAQPEPVQVAMAEGQKQEEADVPRKDVQGWVDLLPQIDLKRDRVAGEWRVEEGELTSSDGEFARVVSPVEVKGSYDLKAAFTRNKGNNAIGILLPVGDRACALVLSGWNGAICGLEMVDGRSSNDNPTTNRTVKIANGRRYDLLARVRLQRQSASIEAYLDGALILKWQGNQSSLSLYGAWRLPGTRRVGLGSHQPTTFHAARIKMVADEQAASEDVKVVESMDGSKPAQEKADRQSEEPSSSRKAGAAKAASEDRSASSAKKDLADTLNLLRKKLRGRVAYDRRTEQFVLTYDWTTKPQLEDFKTKAKLSFTRGRLVLEAGESVTCIVPFKEVTISTSVLVPQMKGTMIKTSGGVHAYVGGANVDTIYLESGEGDRPYLIVPKPQRTGVQPFQVTVSEHRLGFAYGIGEPSKIGKPVSNYYAGNVMLFGGELGYQYAKLVLAGTIDERWLKPSEDE